MRRIHYPKLGDSFHFHRHWSKRIDYFYLYHQSFFNIPNYYLGLLLFLFVTSFFKSLNLMVLMVLLVLLLTSFFLVKKMILSLFVRRKLPQTLKEEESFKMDYFLKNSSPFTIRFDLLDLGELYPNGFYQTKRKSLPSHSKKLLRRTLTSSVGMGVKKLKSLFISVDDMCLTTPLLAEHELREEILILPKLEKFYSNQYLSNRESIRLGLIEEKKRGDSTNFIGVREYVVGDPIKRINWKLTLKHGMPIVNEFEKMSNARVSLVVNLLQSYQVGHGKLSTWEFIKDLTLSIGYFQQKQSNDLQIMSPDFYIPYGHGQKHFHFIERKICESNLSTKKDFEFFRHYHAKMKQSSYLYFLSPLYPHKNFISELESMLKLKALGVDVRLVTIDPTLFLGLHAPDEQTIFVQGILSYIKTTKEKILLLKKKYSFEHYNFSLEESSYHNIFIRGMRSHEQISHDFL